MKLSPRRQLVNNASVGQGSVGQGSVGRRALLRSFAASAGAFVPLLNARPSLAGPTAYPRRLVIVQWTNGVLPEYWPQLPSPGQEFTLTNTLSPLERHKKDVIVLGGLKIPFTLRTGHFSLPQLLTGSPGARGLNDEGVAIGNSVSLDQHVANGIANSSPTRFRSLEIGAAYLDGQDLFRSISFRGPAVHGRPTDNPPEIDPYRLWRRLFGQGASDRPSSSNGFARLRRERRSVLDYVTRDLSVLARDLGRDDRQKLQSHLESVRQIERELDLGATQEPSAAPFCSPVRPPEGIPVSDPTQIDRLVAQQLDLLVMALRCDLVRVATVMLINAHNGNVTYPFLGPEFREESVDGIVEHHGIAHKGGPMKAQVDKWWIGQFAELLDRLKLVPEGEGTMLDNTAILFANNMGNGASHSVAGLPWILAGNCQGQFKTGRYLYPSGWNPVRPSEGCVPTNGVLVALANAMQTQGTSPLATFGDPSFVGELPALRG